jgi:hypothetical protein
MVSDVENVLIRFYKSEMIAWMQEHPEAFEEAVRLAVSDKQPYAWRAAWLLHSCLQVNDKRMQPHVGTIIKAIGGKKDGHQRELIKILLQMQLKKGQEGILFSRCADLWEDINKNPSVRITALRFMIKTAKKHPELLNEISFLIQDHLLETLSPGIKHSVARMIQESGMNRNSLSKYIFSSPGDF